MDGFRVMPMAEAAKEATFHYGNGQQERDRAEHFEQMKSGAVGLQQRPLQRGSGYSGARTAFERQARSALSRDEYALKDGPQICLIGEGRLVNLATAEGHPASVMT